MSYCCGLGGGTDVRVEVEERNLQLPCWIFDKPCASHNLMHGGSHWMRTLEVGFHEQAGKRNPFSVGWHHLELLTLPQREHHHSYVMISSFR